MKPDPAPEILVDRMAFLARQLGNHAVDPGRERRFVESLGERLAIERAAVKRQRVAWGATLAMAMLLGPVIGYFAFGETELSYRLSGAVATNGLIFAQERTEVVFSDGSKVELAPGARAEVADVTGHGATVRLVEGSVALDIVKAKANVWAVQAGPYRVHVVGTAFDVRWSEVAKELEVNLLRGSVYVTGPKIQGELRLEPGQRLTSGLDGLRVTRAAERVAAQLAPTAAPLETADGAQTDVEGMAVERTSAAASTEMVDSKMARRESLAGPSPSWASWVAQGQYNRVIAAAKQRGVEDVLTRGTQSELAAFADASRYALVPKLARRALLAERRRFPKAAASRGSAFFLGGIEADGSASALAWFEQYLAEAPNGSYVPQALGRRMMLVHRQRGKGESTALAREYLRRFPQGPYATAAQQILGQFSE